MLNFRNALLNTVTLKSTKPNQNKNKKKKKKKERRQHLTSP